MELKQNLHKVGRRSVISKRIRMGDHLQSIFGQGLKCSNMTSRMICPFNNSDSFNHFASSAIYLLLNFSLSGVVASILLDAY